MSYDKWKRRLAGEKVETFTQPDHEDEGYYRKPVTVKQANGRNRVVGWIAVAYFIDPFVADRLCCVIGDRDATDDEAIEVWTWCVSHPISEELYRSVADNGNPWPDIPNEMVIENDTVFEVAPAIGHNQPPPEEAIAPNLVMEEKIMTAINAAPDLKVIESDEQAELVAGSRNRILELKNEAAKAGEAIYKPHYANYKKEYDLWTPMVKRAEAKAAEQLKLIQRHEQKKRDDAAAAEAAAQRAADRAIAAGVPETAPEVAPTPAPKAQVKPSYGRAIPMREKTFVVIDDIAKAASCYLGRQEVVAIITQLAQADVDAGITVPGTHTRKGVI